MINPVEYLKMVHTVVTVMVVDQNGNVRVGRNANRIGISLSQDSLGGGVTWTVEIPDGTAQAASASLGMNAQPQFTWLFHGDFPTYAFSATGLVSGETIVVVELILRSCDTDAIANG